MKSHLTTDKNSAAPQPQIKNEIQFP